MHPLLSKMMTCVCAAGTGAAVMPAAHAVQRHYAPHHVARHASVVPAAAARQRSDCLPGAILAGGATAPMAPLVLDGGAAAVPPGAADGFPFGPPSGIDRLTPASATGGSGGFGGGGDGGFYGPGGGGGGSGPGGGQPGGGTPGNPPATGGGTPPSALPEPASWALMVTGFGALGGALRMSRRASVGEREVVEVKLG